MKAGFMLCKKVRDGGVEREVLRIFLPSSLNLMFYFAKLYSQD